MQNLLKWTCENGNEAKLSVPDNITKDDLLAIAETYELTLKHKYGIDLKLELLNTENVIEQLSIKFAHNEEDVQAIREIIEKFWS